MGPRPSGPSPKAKESHGLLGPGSVDGRRLRLARGLLPAPRPRWLERRRLRPRRGARGARHPGPGGRGAQRALRGSDFWAVGRG